MNISMNTKRTLTMVSLAGLGLAALSVVGPTVQKFLAINIWQQINVGVVVGVAAVFGAYMMYRREI